MILRTFANKPTYSQAGEITGISDWQTRRWRERYEEVGDDELFEPRFGESSPKRVLLGDGGANHGIVP